MTMILTHLSVMCTLTQKKTTFKPYTCILSEHSSKEGKELVSIWRKGTKPSPLFLHR